MHLPGPGAQCRARSRASDPLPDYAGSSLPGVCSTFAHPNPGEFHTWSLGASHSFYLEGLRWCPGTELELADTVIFSHCALDQLSYLGMSGEPEAPEEAGFWAGGGPESAAGSGAQAQPGRPDLGSPFSTTGSAEAAVLLFLHLQEAAAGARSHQTGMSTSRMPGSSPVTSRRSPARSLRISRAASRIGSGQRAPVTSRRWMGLDTSGLLPAIMGRIMERIMARDGAAGFARPGIGPKWQEGGRWHVRWPWESSSS